MPEQPVRLESARDVLLLDAEDGRLLSLTRRAAPARGLLAAGASQCPAFALQYLSAEREYVSVDSSQAAGVETVLATGRATFLYREIAGLDLDVAVTVTAALDDDFLRWSLAVDNRSGVRIVDVQCPFVVLPAEGTVVVPAGLGGHLIEGEGLSHLAADEPRTWQFLPENGDSQHYPGSSYAQFLAWYAPDAGVYLACDDTEGNVKLLKAVRREEGVRLGVAHVGDWPEPGQRTLEYSVLLRSFEGDWYDAADLYRDWTLRQAWATPLTERIDVPAWLLESPLHLTIRLQGYLDDGPAPAIAEFLPYEKCIPLLERVASRTESPLVAVLMSWERGGPWVYPDCFPPVGGEESLSRFVEMARERGWQVGSFCNGTRWVVRHSCNGYDGWEYYRQHGGERGVCRTHRGEPWAENWDANWRPSYACCAAQEQTASIATEFVGRLAGWGMRSIQFFDQNINAATFPCFAEDHGHPAVPGKWMAAAMADLVASFRRATDDAGATEAIQSTENACNEFCLPLFPQCDVRVSPPSAGATDYIPLYQYLFHECIVMHGMMSTGPEPHSLPVRTAWCFAWGGIPGAVMTGDGTLLNRDTFNWAPWEPKVGSDDHALEMLRVTAALRRGRARDLLVTGRMLRPAEVACDLVEWEYAGRVHRVPAVAHSAWRSPTGRHGIVLANWTDEPRAITLHDSRLEGASAVVTIQGATAEDSVVPVEDGVVRLTLPPLSAAVL